MAPTKQKALLPDSNFGNFVVDAGHALIRVLAASLNPLDWKFQRAGILVKSYPAIVDIVDVVELGEGVTMCHSKLWLLKYLNFRDIPKIPDNWTYDKATTLSIPFVTAYLCLFYKNPYGVQLPNPIVDGGGKSTGQELVILGGSSSVGQYALQLAKLAGFSTIIATASLDHADFLKSLGATHVIDRNTSKVILQEEHVFDAISSPETQQLWHDLLSPEGQIVIVLRDSIQSKVEGRKVNEVRWVYAEENYDASVVLCKNFTALLEEGVIKPVMVEVLPNGPAGIPEVNKVSRVKLVARPQTP
ncbi:hypothetical protein M378DRAFT_186563 [Amanita muscaria Koide BX008]|uniref:Enoyl reductase (ER) domain-containing protein n=1 Tax=Amanita muscaria (strain Koide BX008) TaxID=946122 RepID=A0A0C2WTX9_AMAMK|nr:hypothetical protein M378DRAFT_186563 [Amanita muscaria Koide BX008]